MDVYKERLLTIHKTSAWAVMSPEELELAYQQTKLMVEGGSASLNEIEYMSLVELLFYFSILLSEDEQAERLYQTVTDRFGEDSPRIHLMKATLLQVTNSDDAAKHYIKDLIRNQLEISTDSEDYVQMQKKLLTLERSTMEREIWVQKLLDLVEKFPLDAEIWSILSHEYKETGNLDQAIHCMEEVILGVPFNFEAFGQLSYLQYLRAQTSQHPERFLQDSLNNALRSVELAGAFVKGWGLVLKASELLGKTALHNFAEEQLKKLQGGNVNDKLVNVSKFLLST